MKKLILILLLIPLVNINAQKLGEIRESREKVKYPGNSYGVDLIFTEGGFGLGGFYKTEIAHSLNAFVDFSISEVKDEREVEYIDYWGYTHVSGKKNRGLLMPLNFGIQKRLFEETLTDNLRPYITAAIGPTMLLSAPYLDADKQPIEFFSSLKYSKMHYTLGGYIGFGANMGTNNHHFLSISVKYYIVHLFGDGIETLDNTFRKDFNSVFLTISIGKLFD